MTEAAEDTRYVEYMDVDQIVPALRNPRKHDLDQLRRSFERWGFTIPIMRDERTGRIVAGHGRCQLLQFERAAAKAPPDGVMVADGNVWMVPVTRGWASADDAEAEAYLVTDNYLAEAAGWDDEKLLEGLRFLKGTPAGLTGVGFESEDIDDIYARIQERANRATPTPQANQRHSQIRSLVLDFPLEEYAYVAKVAQRARAAYGVTSNPELFLAILREKTETWD